MKINISKATRKKRIDILKKGVDLLIIGGGINGAGILRDASLRGLKCGLLEKNDFASGSSSRSSKLIHGGLRYLENMDFSLVMESCKERALLLKLAPNLVKPTKFLMPIYKNDRIGPFLMNIGMWLYDILALFRNFKNHKKISLNKMIDLSPFMGDKNVKGCLQYYDALVNDARLVLNNIVLSITNGALPLNYIEVKGVNKLDGKITSAIAFDHLTKEEFIVPCKSFVSAVGPWTNNFQKVINGLPKNFLRLTKGIHLIFSQSKFKTNSAVVIMSNDDRRIIFVIPWEDYTIVGTTDTDFNGDINEVYSTSSDVDYLLELVNQKFPKLYLKADDAISAFAGLRPLLLTKGSASKVSREDKVLRGNSSEYIVGGGKLTTYRSISEKTVNLILKELPKEITKKLKPCQTNKLPLIKTLSSDEEAKLKTISKDIDAQSFYYLKIRYGIGAIYIVTLIKEKPELGKYIYSNLPFIYAEIIYAVNFEMLKTITDFFRLRTEIYLKTRDNGLDTVEKCLDILAKELNLSDNEKEKQLLDYKKYLRNNLSSIGRKLCT